MLTSALTADNALTLAADIRGSLTGISDSVRAIENQVSSCTLSTVMGLSRLVGSTRHKERIRVFKSNTDLTAAIAGCADTDKAYQQLSVIAKHLTDLRVSALMSDLQVNIDAHFAAEVTPAINDASSITRLAMTKVQQLASLKGDKHTAGLSPARTKALADYKASTMAVSTAVTAIRLAKKQIDTVNTELSAKFDATDILSTAMDTDRTRLVELRRQLGEQREYAERKMLGHFDETAKARSYDARPLALDLEIPNDLIQKARGAELIMSMNDLMRTSINQFYAITPVVYRVGADYDYHTGTYWRPPCCFNDYMDVDISFRDEYRAHSTALSAKFKAKYGENALSVVYSTNRCGNNGQFEMKAHESDGVMIYFCLIMMSTSSSSAYRDDIDQDISRSPDGFQTGDPTKRVAKLKKTILEAKRLGIRMRWSYGKKIITHLSSRHNTFAVKLSPLEGSCVNQDDASDHFDKLCSSILAACADIKIASGDHWHQQIAMFSSDRGSNRDQQALCRFGSKCRFGKDCKNKHLPSDFQGNDSRRSEYQGRRSSSKHGPPCVVKGCGGLAPPTPPGGAVKELCSTCFRKAIQDGFYVTKDGKKKSMNKAKKAAMKARAKKRTRPDDQDQDKPFSDEQMKVLSVALSANAAQTVPTIQIPGTADQSINHALNALTLNRGPKSAKMNVFQRLGDSVKASIEEQAGILMSAQHLP